MYSQLARMDLVNRMSVTGMGDYVNPYGPPSDDKEFAPEPTRCNCDCDNCNEDCEAKTKVKKELSATSLSSGYIERARIARVWGVPEEQIKAWTKAGRLTVFCERDGGTYYSRSSAGKARKALCEEYGITNNQEASGVGK